MWEVEGHYQPAIEGKVGVLRERMIHRDHVSLYHYFERHNKYSDWEAVWRHKKLAMVCKRTDMTRRHSLKRLFDALPFKGTIAFLDSYMFKQGFRDGYEGFQYAVARGFYYWQSAVKLRELKLGQRQPLPVVFPAESPGETDSPQLPHGPSAVG